MTTLIVTALLRPSFVGGDARWALLAALLGGAALNVVGLVLIGLWVTRVRQASADDLQDLQRQAVALEVLAKQAPVGICTVDMEGRLLTTNPTFDAMQGGSSVGKDWRDNIHPDHRKKDVKGYIRMFHGEIDRYVTESLHLRTDGSTYWGSVLTTPLRGPDGRMTGFISIIEDITERKEQLELAARIQRALLPKATPILEGYDLAAVCLPAQDVAGDFYDWFAYGGQYLDLTLADVVGSGVPAALVTAALRTALRAASPELGPAQRVWLAAELMELGMENEGLFVTLFHGRLNLASGELRYVDAGHGYCEVLRRDGQVEPLPVHSLPVGVLKHHEFSEGVARLEPGETLVLYSDGLVEREDHTLDLGDFAEELDQGGDAPGMVQRLVAGMPRRLADDVTVVILRRLADGSPAPASPHSD